MAHKENEESGSGHLICLTQHVIPISINNRKVPGLLPSRVIEQGSTTTSSHQRLHILCKFVTVSTNSRTEFKEARKEGRGISHVFLQPRPPKLTGNPACLHTSPSNDTLATLLKESIKPCRIYATPLYTSKQAMLSVHIAALVGQL